MSAVRIEAGDMREVLARLIAEGVTVQSICTDPPYHLTSIVKRFGADNAAPAKSGKTGAYARASAGFMGKQWDGGDIAFQASTWRLCYDLLPPGGHLLAFSGTRTYHRMACAIEDAGFEIRDMVSWLYGSGFPKSHNVAKGIDKAAGAEREVVGFDVEKYRPNRDKHLLSGQPGGGGKLKADNGATITAPATDAARQWEGWGTALKPALEPICLARKPLAGTVAANVLEHGTGALNVDGCRIPGEPWAASGEPRGGAAVIDYGDGLNNSGRSASSELGRWPANVVHDGSAEVERAFPETGAGGFPASRGKGGIGNDGHAGQDGLTAQRLEGGSAARFFYSAKADATDRLGSKHPTVKPVDLMRWLVRLITPPGGTVLDPFAGTGTTGMACMAEGLDCILVERELEYLADIRRRIGHVTGAAEGELFAGAK